MKKMVRLLSVVMLVAMCFSFMAVGAYAAPVVVVPGSSTTNNGNSSSGTGSGSVFSYGTDPFEQAALEDGNDIEGSVVTEPDGRLKTDGRDNSLFVANVDREISDTIWELVNKYASDVNINNDSNPYYFVWLMDKFVNGEIDYANPDSELETARALFSQFVDEAAENLAVAAASNQVLEENPEMKEALEAVNDDSVHETIDQVVLADEAEKQIEEVATEIINDINGIDNPSYKPTAKKNGNVISLRSAVYDSSSSKLGFKKTAVELHDVIKPNGEITVDEQQSLDTTYDGDIVFDFKNCTINRTVSTPLVVVTGGMFKFKNGIINGYFIAVNGGSVCLDNMKINVPAAATYAVSVKGGAYCDMVRSNYFTSESSSPVVYVTGTDTNAIFDGYINTSTAEYGIKVDGGARVTKNGGDILYSEPATDIFAPTGVYVDEATFVFNGGNITGTANGTGGTGAAIQASQKAATKVSVNNGSTGCILSAYNAAIYENGSGTPIAASIVVSDLSYLKDAAGKKSDVGANENVATVNDVGYATLAEAVAAAAGTEYPVQVITNIESNTTATVPADKSVVINGNGHTIFSTVPVIKTSSGSTLVLNNITLDLKDTAGKNAIELAGKEATLNNVTVENCKVNCVRVTAGNVTVDGLDTEENENGTAAISAGGTADVTVYDMTTKSWMPVELTDTSAKVRVYQAKCKIDSSIATDLDGFKAASAHESDITNKCVASGSSEAFTGGYYYISARQVDVSILSGGAPDGSYLIYEKGKKDQVLQLESSDPVESITAYAADGTPYPINFKPSADYKTVTLTDANLAALEAGEYQVSVKFKNSGAVKIPLYVSPAIKETDKEATTDLFLTKYNKDKELWQYDAQSHKDGWIKIPNEDMPQHIGLGPDRDNVIWLSDANIEGAEVDATKTKVTLTHDDLDHLGNGVNYVWLDYGTYWVPVKFEVYNAAATITPSTTDWNKIDGDKVFTVWPDVLTVKLNGQSLENDNEYTYKDGKLTLKGSFLKKLANGNYTLEVSTSKGGVFADMTIGEVLRPKDIDYHVYGGAKPITFIGSNTIDYSKGIWIGKQNPVQIPEEYYTINSDNTFTLSAAYLNRLTTLGTYYISAYVGGQYCTTTFRIISASQAAYNPSTGDVNLTIWIVIAALAAVVIVVILVPMLKKQSKKTSADAKKKDKDK